MILQCNILSTCQNDGKRQESFSYGRIDQGQGQSSVCSPSMYDLYLLSVIGSTQNACLSRMVARAESLSWGRIDPTQETLEGCKAQSILWIQVKQNVQRTLAIELQKLSIQFRKQQKQFLKKVSQKDGVTLSSSSLSVLDESGPSLRSGEDDYDPGFSDLQVAHICPK